MGIADLTGPRAKLGRAYEHIQAMDIEVLRLSQDRTQAGVVTCRREDGWYIIEMEHFPPLPLRLSLIIGDCLNNLHAVLDHLIWQLVLREDQKPGNHHCFPICETREKFVEKVELPSQRPNKRFPLEGIPGNGRAWAIIKDSQPFQREHPEMDPLALLSQLSNIDKHNTLLMQQAIVDVWKFLDSVFWGTQEQPIERLVRGDYLPAEHPAEIARLRFAEGTKVDVHMNVHPVVYVTICNGETYVPLERLTLTASYVEQILNQVATLPRVQG